MSQQRPDGPDLDAEIFDQGLVKESIGELEQFIDDCPQALADKPLEFLLDCKQPSSICFNQRLRSSFPKKNRNCRRYIEAFTGSTATNKGASSALPAICARQLARRAALILWRRRRLGPIGRSIRKSLSSTNYAASTAVCANRHAPWMPLS